MFVLLACCVIPGREHAPRLSKFLSPRRCQRHLEPHIPCNALSATTRKCRVPSGQARVTAEHCNGLPSPSCPPKGHTLSQTLPAFGTGCQPRHQLLGSPSVSVVPPNGSNPTCRISPSLFHPVRCHPKRSKRGSPIRSRLLQSGAPLSQHAG